MERKRRVLFTGEASYIATGFGTYWNEVLKRLHATGEFEIFEMGSYAYDGDPKNNQVPWKFYPVSPAHNDAKGNEVFRQKSTNQFGEWRFADVCLDCRPDCVIDARDHWMCFTEDTPIIVSDGTPKRIADINVGNKVLSHSGKEQTVVGKMQRKYSGDLFTIKPSNFVIPIQVTSGHPVLIAQRDNPRHLNKDWNNCELIWKNSDNLTKDDFLCFPIPNQIIDNQEYDLDMCRLIGYYLSEGCILYNGRREAGNIKGIQLTFNADHCESIEDVRNIIKDKFGVDATVNRYDTNCMIVRAFNKQIGEYLLRLCGEHSKKKLIAKDVFNLPNDKIVHLLHGIMEDGHLTRGARGNYTTSSPSLAYQVFCLMARLGIIPSMSYNKNHIIKGGRECHRYIFDFQAKSLAGFTKIFDLDIDIQRDTTRSNDKYVFLTIKDLQKTKANNIEVFNLEVEEDNSYVTSFAVHNCEFILRSPLRQNFKAILEPTIDGIPQKELWLDTYQQADGILTYSEWGMEVLKKDGRPNTNLLTVCSPGADLNIFCPPENKADHKTRLGIQPDSIIIGTVMRNQKRKLYYDLIEAFAQWTHKAKTKGHTKLASKTFLYLHTSYPDVGYDIGKAIKEFEVGNKVIMTYLCAKCGMAFPAFFSGETTYCRRRECGQQTAHPPNASHQVPRHILADIMKTFDLYVQYSICMHPETPILTEHGWKNIIDIHPGTKVVGKDGQLHSGYRLRA